MASAGQANFDLINRISEVTMRFMYQLLADLVLTLHAGVAAFVVAGLALIIATYRHYKTTNVDEVNSMKG